MPAPSAALLARWAVQLAPAALPVAKQLYERGRFRQLAILHARTVVDGSFSDEFVEGERVWVVWAGDHPAASYPEVPEDLVEVLALARPERRRDPDELPVQRVRRRVSGLRPPWRRDDGDGAGALDEGTDDGA